MPPSHDARSVTSHSLIWKLRQQDEPAWQRMVELYTPLVHYWCRQSDLSEDETADVTQEVFRTVAQSIDGFQPDPERGTFRGWLRTIFKSRVVDHVRRQGREPRARGGTDALRWLENAPADDADHADAEVQALYRRVLRLIESEFSPEAWQAFQKTTLEGLSSREVASQLGMTPGAVRQSKYRILRRVREELGDVA